METEETVSTVVYVVYVVHFVHFVQFVRVVLIRLLPLFVLFLSCCSFFVSGASSAARKLLVSLRALPLKVEGAEERTLRAVEMLVWYVFFCLYDPCCSTMYMYRPQQDETVLSVCFVCVVVSVYVGIHWCAAD